MNKVIAALLTGLALGAGIAGLYLHGGPSAATPAAEPDKESPLHFTAEQRQKAGLMLAAPTEMEVKAEFHGYGRVIDPSPLVALAAEASAAEVSLAVAQKQLARVKTLYEGGVNASQETEETAEAAVAQAQVQFASARRRLVATWGTAIADKVAHGLVTDLFEKSWTLARVDFPEGEIAGPIGSSVRVRQLAGGTTASDAEVVGPAPTSDPQVPGEGYFVILRDRLAAGTALMATAVSSAPAVKMLTLPKDAVVFHEGSAWVYVLGYKDTFERRLVELGPTVNGNYAINGALASDDQAVISGAQQLLSGELQAGAEPD